MVATRAEDAHCHIVYVNQVGGQDELIFDGASFVVDDDGELRRPAAAAREARRHRRPRHPARVPHPAARPPRPRHRARRCPVVPVSAAVADHPEPTPRRPRSRPLLDPVDEVYDALVLATRDYVTKNGFTDVVFGLSGGIDSSLVAVHRRRRPRRRARARRVDAEPLLVRRTRRTDAEALCRRRSASSCARSPSSRPTPPSSRCWRRASRGCPRTSPRRTCSPASAARSSWRSRTSSAGWLVLTTGNKSELAVGYSTLYGDTAGGFAVIKDVPKLLVYDLCRLVQRAGRPRGRSRSRCSRSRRRPSCGPTSATTSRSRPTRCSTRCSRPTSRTTSRAASWSRPGFDPALVDRITRLVDSPSTSGGRTRPGPRITPKAFGKDRRMPITNGYRG